MPAHIHVGRIKDKIPQGWTPLKIQSITDTNVSKKYALLSIQHRYKHYKGRVNCLKMLLTDVHGHIIDFFAFGQVADDLDICQKGDTLLCLEYDVEESPGHCQRPFQIIADDSNQGKHQSRIWISKPRSSLVPVSPSHDNHNHQGVSDTAKDSPKKVKVRSYNYKMLKEIKVNTVVDVYGVVKFAKPAARGRGSDYYCVIGLVDPSLAVGDEEKLTCVLFNREASRLPDVQEGDVLRLHRLKIQTYQGGKQGYNGPGFHWLAFHGALDSKTSSSDTYTFEDQDKEQVTELLDWWSKENEHAVSSISGPEKQRLTLGAVKPKCYFNIVCQVVQVCVLDHDVCRLLRVWDGTKFEGKLKEVTESELNSSLTGDSVLVEASKGLAVDMFLFDNHAKDSSNIKPRDYLLLTNVHSAVVSDQVELTLHGGGLKFGRGFQVLSPDSSELTALKACLDPLLNTCSNSSGQDAGAEINNSSDRCAQSSGTHNGGKQVVSEHGGSSVCEDHDNDDSNKTSGGNDGASVSARVSPTNPDVPARVSRADPDHSGHVCHTSGRKDVPSKNKTLRKRRKLASATDPFVFNPRDTGLDNKTSEGKDEVENEEQQSSSSEDVSQSIWLSVYNNSGSGRRLQNGESIFASSPSKHRRIFAHHEGLSDSSQMQLRSHNKVAAVTTGNILPTNHGKNVHTDEDALSEGSFVTAPSPDAQKNVLLEEALCLSGSQDVVKDTEPQNMTPKASTSARKTHRHSETRQGIGLRHSFDKRTPLEGGENPESQLRTENEEDISQNFREAEKNAFSQGSEEEQEMFSQGHLEIIDSDILCFDTDEFSQTSIGNTKNSTFKDAQLVEETELPIPTTREEETHTDSLGVGLETNGPQGSEDQELFSPEAHTVGSSSEPHRVETPGGQISQGSACGSREGENSGPSQQAQTDIGGASQMSRSTNSSSSQSHHRCMLRTASVVLNHPGVQRSSLQEVLEHPRPYRFRIQARVERIEPLPTNPSDLVHFFCPQCKFFSGMLSQDDPTMTLAGDPVACPRCVQPPTTLRAVTVLVLHLTDGRRSISAFVWDKMAETFFGGLTAHQLLSDPSSFQQVQQWLSDLCPPGSRLEDRPVLECCVCCYHVGGHVKFQIFGTSLV